MSRRSQRKHKVEETKEKEEAPIKSFKEVCDEAKGRIVRDAVITQDEQRRVINYIINEVRDEYKWKTYGGSVWVLKSSLTYNCKIRPLTSASCDKICETMKNLGWTVAHDDTYFEVYLPNIMNDVSSSSDCIVS